jgi:hypothetical protein
MVFGFGFQSHQKSSAKFFGKIKKPGWYLCILSSLAGIFYSPYTQDKDGLPRQST